MRETKCVDIEVRYIKSDEELVQKIMDKGYCAVKILYTIPALENAVDFIHVKFSYTAEII